MINKSMWANDFVLTPRQHPVGLKYIWENKYLIKLHYYNVDLLNLRKFSQKLRDEKLHVQQNNKTNLYNKIQVRILFQAGTMVYLRENCLPSLFSYLNFITVTTFIPVAFLVTFTSFPGSDASQIATRQQEAQGTQLLVRKTRGIPDNWRRAG